MKIGRSWRHLTGVRRRRKGWRPEWVTVFWQDDKGHALITEALMRWIGKGIFLVILLYFIQWKLLFAATSAPQNKTILNNMYITLQCHGVGFVFLVDVSLRWALRIDKIAQVFFICLFLFCLYVFLN